MIILVNETTQMIIERLDAWAENAVEDAVKYARENGFEIVRDEVNFSGDMIVWCR